MNVVTKILRVKAMVIALMLSMATTVLGQPCELSYSVSVEPDAPVEQRAQKLYEHLCLKTMMILGQQLEQNIEHRKIEERLFELVESELDANGVKRVRFRYPDLDKPIKEAFVQMKPIRKVKTHLRYSGRVIFTPLKKVVSLRDEFAAEDIHWVGKVGSDNHYAEMRCVLVRLSASMYWNIGALDRVMQLDAPPDSEGISLSGFIRDHVKTSDEMQRGLKQCSRVVCIGTASRSGFKDLDQEGSKRENEKLSRNRSEALSQGMKHHMGAGIDKTALYGLALGVYTGPGADTDRAERPVLVVGLVDEVGLKSEQDFKEAFKKALNARKFSGSLSSADDCWSLFELERTE